MTSFSAGWGGVDERGGFHRGFLSPVCSTRRYRTVIVATTRRTAVNLGHRPRTEWRPHRYRRVRRHGSTGRQDPRRGHAGRHRPPPRGRSRRRSPSTASWPAPASPSPPSTATGPPATPWSSTCSRSCAPRPRAPSTTTSTSTTPCAVLIESFVAVLDDEHWNRVMPAMLMLKTRARSARRPRQRHEAGSRPTSSPACCSAASTRGARRPTSSTTSIWPSPCWPGRS